MELKAASRIISEHEAVFRVDPRPIQKQAEQLP
jgi:hypothetical protein